jgi:hypothetical protein
MNLDYKYFSGVITKKYPLKTGIRVLSDLSYSDVKELINNIVDRELLKKLLDETESLKTDKDLGHIKLLLGKKINTPVS